MNMQIIKTIYEECLHCVHVFSYNMKTRLGHPSNVSIYYIFFSQFKFVIVLLFNKPSPLLRLFSKE